VSLLLLLRNSTGVYVPPPVFGDPTATRGVLSATSRIGGDVGDPSQSRIGSSIGSAGRGIGGGGS
jgi:hypothetical protein